MGSGSSSSLEPPGRRRTKKRSKRDRLSDRAQLSGLSPKGPRTENALVFQVVTGLAAAWTLKMRAIKPIERLVPVSYMHYCTYTPGLSTWSSSTVLKGILVLRWVSRLDAFSGYPVRT